MRMKFNRSSQLVLVSAVSLLAAGLVTACGTLTVDFVYVTSAKAAGPNNYGEVDVFEMNSESGCMRQIPTSPFPSGGRNPVAEAVSADSRSLRGESGRQHHRPVRHRQRRQALSAEHRQHAGSLSAGGGSDRQLPLVVGHLPAAADLLHSRAVLGSVAVFPILSAAQATALSAARSPQTHWDRPWPTPASAPITGR